MRSRRRAYLSVNLKPSSSMAGTSEKGFIFLYSSPKCSPVILNQIKYSENVCEVWINFFFF